MKKITFIMAALLAISLSACSQSKKPEQKSMKTLVAYFSATGVTKGAAQQLAQATGGTLYEIQPEQPYTEADLDWSNKQSRSSIEMQDKSSRPAIKGKLDNMADYDTIFVGFPIWWYTCPTIINTFIEQYDLKGKTVIPFRLTYRVKGSTSLMVKPYGENTEVRMHSDCPDPSFTGDFLPSEREVSEQGFTARWSVSEINRGKPDDTSFGVNLLQGVTQYQKSMRSAKYGILVILLVFIAGLAVELVGKKKINLVQYLVIGFSLVLFYALVLSFSEFMSFSLAYVLAALMTVAALFGYFRGILRDRSAWLLTALVAVAYLLSYVLLQMETYAFLAGTLVLFALLVGIMYLTRGLNREEGELKTTESH